MAENTAQLPLLIVILSMSLTVISAAVACWQASRCTRLTNSLRELLTTPPSAARLETLAAEQAEFASSLQKLSTTVKRLSSRYGMAELRSRPESDPDSPPPIGAPKAQLRLWASRKVGRQVGPAPVNFERMSEE